MLLSLLVGSSALHRLARSRAAAGGARAAAGGAVGAGGRAADADSHGYDIHRMAPREEAGQPLVVGGATFDGSTAPDFELGCVAHSDGDVIYHSVVDAILGALTMPDIGQLFPDNDPRLKGSNSEIFMEEAYSRMVDRGYAIGNVDVTLIAQKPRVNVEHAGALVKERMGNLARLLRTDVSRVNVKARTTRRSTRSASAAIECHVSLILERDPSLPEGAACATLR